MTNRSSLYDRIANREEPLAVVGLGYVGLPIAVAFARKADVVGFDVNERKIDAYRRGIDSTGDVGKDALLGSGIGFTSDPDKLSGVRFFVVAVPTPVMDGNVPDLSYVREASRLVGGKLTRGAIVVFESTVYPGVTEDVCVPILEEQSGLRCGVDFKVGYSPERINPGDKVHRLENIVKIVSGMDEEALETIARVYELIIEAGVFRASSIKVAEAAKVIENAQRDINIAFMNELSMLFGGMGIETKAVLEAAATKWNFLPFTPGLVGGHCIGVDPYYLTYKAEDTGYHSKIISAGRQVNESMGKYVAQQIIKLLAKSGMNVTNARIGILGLSYKEDSSDIRNTKVKDIIRELKEYGIVPIVCDPYVDRAEAYRECGVELKDFVDIEELNAVVIAVPHMPFRSLDAAALESLYRRDGVKLLIDIKGAYDRSEYERLGFHYWSL